MNRTPNSISERSVFPGDEEITAVVQGPITPYTAETLASLRKFMPKSKVILSTWENSDVAGLDFDELIENKDPYADTPPPPTNANRMFISTLNGLRAVRTEYALKIRTDFYLTGTNFKRLFSRNYPRPEKYALFEDRLVCYAWKFNPEKVMCLGDFYFFGKTRDIISLFDIPLMSDEDMCWFRTHPLPDRKYYDKCSGRYITEQHLWISFLRKCGVDVPVMDKVDFKPGYKELTEDTFFANFIFSNFSEFSIATPKEYLLSFNFPNPKREYSYSDFLNFCKERAEGDFDIAAMPKVGGEFGILSKVWVSVGRLIPRGRVKSWLRKNMGGAILNSKGK